MEKIDINIAVIGKSGVGKSSFCNYVFGETIFTTGTGKPVTGWEDHFKKHSVTYENFELNIYDSVGIEPNNYSKWSKRLRIFLRENGPDSNLPPTQWLHAALYLINAASARVEPVELDLIRELTAKNLPVSIVLTNCDSATSDQISQIRETITNEAGEISINEICSVSVRKRSGTTELKGKDETLKSLLNNLDYSLRRQLICYYLDLYYNAMKKCRDDIFDKIEKSSLGTFNILKGLIKDGDQFQIDSIFPEIQIEHKAMNELVENIEGLNSFLEHLGYVSTSKTSTNEIIDSLSYEVSCQMDSVSCSMDEKLTSISSSLEKGNFIEKTKAVTEIAKAVLNLKGFFKEQMSILFDETLNFIENKKIEIISEKEYEYDY